MKSTIPFTAVLLLLTVALPPARAADPINLRLTPIVSVIEKTKDAVVYISSRRMVSQPVVDPFFQTYMGERSVPVGSLGSGFIVHPEGYIVTNNHVVDKARQINVELLDGRKFDAELVSADAEVDLAILKIKTEKPLPFLELGDSSDLMPGEPVIAVGNPLGFSHSVSEGIVSALHRDLKGDEKSFTDLIQTDAAINPGNSGGPLLNIYGQVIGINTAIRGDAQNIGFAIQINRLRDLIPDLMNPAQVTKLDIPIKLREHRTISPPAKVDATIEQADGTAVISIGGQQPKTIIDAYAILLQQKAGQTFAVELKNKNPLKINPKKLPPPEAISKAKEKMGLTVEAMTPRIAEQFGLPVEDGIRIVAIDKGSWGERVKLHPGDIIRQIGPFRILTLDDFGYLLQQLTPGRQFTIQIVRDGVLLPPSKLAL